MMLDRGLRKASEAAMLKVVKTGLEIEQTHPYVGVPSQRAEPYRYRLRVRRIPLGPSQTFA